MFLVKLMVSLAVLAGAAEVAKRSSFAGAAIIALPLTSMLSMVWLYWDTRDAARVSEFARDIFFLVPASLAFFLPFLVESRTHWAFWQNFALGVVLAVLGIAFTRYMLR